MLGCNGRTSSGGRRAAHGIALAMATAICLVATGLVDQVTAQAPARRGALVATGLVDQVTAQAPVRRAVCRQPGRATPPSIGRSSVLHAVCPAGTVPQPIGRYVLKARPAGRVSRPSARTLTGSGSCPYLASAGADYCWATARDDPVTPAIGATANFTEAQPWVEAGDSSGHSLAEIWAGTVDHNQGVEVGWGVFPGIYGDSLPHLWVFHWVNGVGMGYNADFVQVSATRIPGMVVAVTGVPSEYAIEYFAGNWWIQYQGEWIGYFPGTLWGGTFTEVEEASWYGEVSADTTEPATAMGNGLLGTNVASAQISNIALIGGPATSLYWIPPTAAYYAMGQEGANSFNYGGPGAPSPTTTALATSANPSPAGQEITFTATVSPTSATGLVIFVDGSNTLGSATLSGGTAALTTSALALGNNSITATYGGDANDSASWSAALIERVFVSTGWVQGHCPVSNPTCWGSAAPSGTA